MPGIQTSIPWHSHRLSRGILAGEEGRQGGRNQRAHRAPDKACEPRTVVQRKCHLFPPFCPTRSQRSLRLCSEAMLAGCGMQARSIILRRSSCPSAPCSDSVIGLQHMLFNAFTASTVDGTAVNARASPRVGAWVPAGFPCTIAPCVGFPGNTASRFNQFCNPRRIPVQVWSMPATGCFTRPWTLAFALFFYRLAPLDLGVFLIASRPWTLAFALFFYRLAPLGLGVTRAVMPRLVDTRAFGRSTMVASSFIMCVSTARERLGK